MAHQQTVTLAHLSDVHLPSPPALTLRHMNAKRALGYMNWRRTRRGDYSFAVLDALVADMLAQAPDHIAVTGDLVNLGLPSEIEAARHWLEALGPPDRISVIPGNHDVYVPMATDPGIGRWRPFMSAPGEASPDSAAPARRDRRPPPPEFPYVRRVGKVALIGLNSAIPTPVFVAAGRLGGPQIARLEQTLADLDDGETVRVVMIHHPPLPGQAPHRRALADAAELSAVLQRRGADLVLHGHNHVNSLIWANGPAGPIPVVGITPASAGRSRHGTAHLARYNLLSITTRPGAPPKIALAGRGLAETAGSVVALEERLLRERPSDRA